MPGVSIGAAALAAGITASGAGTTAAAGAGIGTRRERRAAKRAAMAHQIEVEDLKKAGLNPILSAMGGSGAANVQPMSAEMAHMPDVSGLPLRREELRIQNKLAEAETAKKGAEADYYDQMSRKALQDTLNTAVQTRTAEKALKILDNQKFMSDMQTQMMRNNPWLFVTDKIKEYLPFVPKKGKQFNFNLGKD